MALTLIIGYLAGNNLLKAETTVTIFSSLSVKEEPGDSSLSTSYDNVQAADHFTETVQGWFKNPIFINKLKSAVPISDISAERQEKQNLFILYTVDNRINVDSSAEEVKKQLNTEIENYNRASNTDFQIALFDFESGQKETKAIYLILLLFALGAVLGISYSYLQEYLLNRVQSTNQIENIFLRSVDEDISIGFAKSASFKYLPYLIRHNEFKNLNIVTVGFKSCGKINELAEQIDHQTTSIIEFPEEIKKLDNELENFNIIVIKKGKTTLRQALMLKKIIVEHYALAII